MGRKKTPVDQPELDLGARSTAVAINPAEYDEVHTSMRALLASRKGSKREAYRNMQKAQAIRTAAEARQAEPVSEVIPEKISLAERIKTLHEHHDFYPVSRIEANQALGLLHDLGTPFATIRYLNEAFKRQSKPGTDIIHPARTTLGLVREFGNHAADAKMTRILLGDLSRRLDGVNPHLKMVDISDEVPLDLLIPVYRNRQITRAVNAARLDPARYEDMGGVLDFDYMASPFEGDFQQAVTDYASSMTVMGTRLAAEDIDLQQAYRFKFWNARVEEAYRHVPSRDAVRMVGGITARTHYVEPIA